jgi:hypothetical protein
MRIEAGKEYILNNGTVCVAVWENDPCRGRFKYVMMKGNNAICHVDEYGLNQHRNVAHEYDVKGLNMISIEIGKKYVIGDGRIVTAFEGEDENYPFALKDDYDYYIADVNHYGKAYCMNKTYGVLREYKETKMEKVKQVYLDEISGKTFDSLEELERAREVETTRVELQIILDTNCNLDDVIDDIKRSVHRDRIIKFLTENTKGK